MAVKQIKKNSTATDDTLLNAFSVHGDVHMLAPDLHHNLVRELFCVIFTIRKYPSLERTRNLLIYAYLVAEANSKVSLTPS